MEQAKEYFVLGFVEDNSLVVVDPVEEFVNVFALDAPTFGTAEIARQEWRTRSNSFSGGDKDRVFKITVTIEDLGPADPKG